jgi:hypothetical protein
MQYGWSHVYWMTIEGIPFLPCERALSKTVPIGFGSEVATLVVDNSARVGAVIDRNTGIGAGFPLSFKLLDSPTMSAYMTRQTVVRYLAVGGQQHQSSSDARRRVWLDFAGLAWARVHHVLGHRRRDA